jgi:hypothetical protein
MIESLVRRGAHVGAEHIRPHRAKHVTAIVRGAERAAVEAQLRRRSASSATSKLRVALASYRVQNGSMIDGEPRSATVAPAFYGVIPELVRDEDEDLGRCHLSERWSVRWSHLHHAHAWTLDEHSEPFRKPIGQRPRSMRASWTS